MSNVKRLVKESVATPYNKILSVVLANWRLGVGGLKFKASLDS